VRRCRGARRRRSTAATKLKDTTGSAGLIPGA